eukprot:TRINITY_DN8114_c0_g1_i4.p1 TRINITY_DN8114_c0_g1~~TRINITY_DN8114_c0_g1_i4.p1  ORF type:complete len:365 (+),score=24.41 TRINITY_DN8114_c0_g1_i4:91-1185(+)
MQNSEHQDISYCIRLNPTWTRSVDLRLQRRVVPPSESVLTFNRARCSADATAIDLAHVGYIEDHRLNLSNVDLSTSSHIIYSQDKQETMPPKPASDSDAKPFVCRYCSKSFAQKGNLTVHIRTHTGLKPFKCDVCNKAFTTSSYLKHHRQLHDQPSSRLWVSRSTASRSDTDDSTVMVQSTVSSDLSSKRAKFWLDTVERRSDDATSRLKSASRSRRARNQSSSSTPVTSTTTESSNVEAPIISSGSAYRHPALTTNVAQRSAVPIPTMAPGVSSLFTGIASTQPNLNTSFAGAASQPTLLPQHQMAYLPMAVPPFFAPFPPQPYQQQLAANMLTMVAMLAANQGMLPAQAPCTTTESDCDVMN